MTSGPGRKQRSCPTPEQEELLRRELGKNRWIWNYLTEGWVERRVNRLRDQHLAKPVQEIRELSHLPGGGWLARRRTGLPMAALTDSSS